MSGGPRLVPIAPGRGLLAGGGASDLASRLLRLGLRGRLAGLLRRRLGAGRLLGGTIIAIAPVPIAKKKAPANEIKASL